MADYGWVGVIGGVMADDRDDVRDELEQRRPDWAGPRPARTRGWSILLTVAGPVLAVTSFLMIAGFSLHSTFTDPATAPEFLRNVVAALVVGGLLPLAGAVALAVVCVRTRSRRFAGALVAGCTGLLVTVLLVPAILGRYLPDARQYAADLDRAPAAERQQREDMQRVLEDVYTRTVQALPDARVDVRDGASTDWHIEQDDWYRTDCRLSVGHDGVEWTVVSNPGFDVADLADTIDAVVRTAEDAGWSVDRTSDDQTGEPDGVVVRTTEGTVRLHDRYGPDDEGHSSVEVTVWTHCVRE